MLNKKIARITIDCFMLVTLIVTLVTMRGNMIVHTVFGFLFVAFMAIHIWQTRKWMIGICKKFNKVKPKMRRHFIVNVILKAMWVVCIVTGIIIGIEAVAGWDYTMFLGVRRIHGITGIIACVLTVVHIFQHRQRLMSLLKRKKRVQEKTAAN